MSTQLIIADDHALFAESLAENLVRHGDFEILKIISNGKELLNVLNFQTPDIILLDFNMPEMDGLLTSVELKQRQLISRTIIITMHSSIAVVKPLMELGIQSIVLKNTSTSELVQAIQNVLDGKTYFSQEIVRNLTKGFQNKIEFTKREKEMIEYLRKGLSTKEIADQLFISTHTVESHRKNLLAKTNTKNTLSMLKKIDEDAGI